MLYALIVTPDQAFAEATEHCLIRGCHVDGTLRCNGIEPEAIQKILLSSESDNLHGFREAEEAIEGYLHEKDVIHDRFIGIIQLDACDMSCAGKIHPLGSLQGGLILAFPEIQWIPVYGRWAGKDEAKAGCMTWERAIELCRNGYSPLFDGDGLRSCLMLQVRKRGTCYARADAALAVDEEVNFAQMNAYAAYRFGYRAYPVPSRAVADELLRGSAENLPTTATLLDTDVGGPSLREFRRRLAAPVAVVFEDVQLQFPDDKPNDPQSRKMPPFGVRRDAEYQLLREADLRVVATASRREEKIADDGKSTVEHYFLERGKPVGGRLRRERERLRRWWFNTSGGWAGHWFVNTMDAMLITGVLLFVFFGKVSLLPPVLFGLFLLRGVSRHGFQMASVRERWLPEGVRRFFVRRWQWRFLPKRYRNHCPENRICGKKDKFWAVTHKPLAGIFGLRNECCLPNGRGFQGLYDSEAVRKHYQAAIRGEFARCDEENISHAAPGMALEIAVRLLRRAERLVVENQIIDAEGAIHGAVLATVAGELLDAKTPAVSIEALTWKHFFEIRAECEFVGVRAHTDMVDRYIDIHNAMGRICRSSNGLVREDVFTSGMAELMDKLSSLLAEKGKKEESLFFEKKARMFHRRLMGPMGRNLLAYPEWLLRSAWHVVIGLVALLIVSCAFWMSRVPHEHPLTVYQAATQTYEMLFCDEPDFNCETLAGYSIILRTMRQIVMLHLAFLGLCFWDVMRKK